ncbi:hypothetical protein [Paenibacillus sp. FSL H7-0331]|uniref:hypothetical protein n=1 Tax=Paenibacillus sp. FSL H7-0331 TaxID=1920421 RepID=UPI0015C4073F|nr:hypothetical protein [Paenibacillus sp. FSL H7-0331]
MFATTVTINSDGPNSGKTALAIFQQYLGSDPIDGPKIYSGMPEAKIQIALIQITK